MTVHDLSERKDCEEFLYLSEKKFSTTFYLSPAPMVITDPETGRISDVNKAFEADSGYASSELIGHDASEFSFWNSSDERDRFVKTLTKEGNVGYSEMIVRAKSGELRNVLSSSALIRIDGKPHILTHVHDITLNKRIEEKNKTSLDLLESTIRDREEDFHMAVERHHRLEKEKQMLALVIHNTKEAVCVADLEGRIIFANNAGSKMVGIAPGEMPYHFIFDFIPEAYKDIAASEIVPAILEQGSWEGELQYRNLRTGMLIDVHAIAFLIKDPLTEKPLYMANLSVDITERKRAEREMHRYRNHLEDLVRERTTDLEERNTLLQAEIAERRKAVEALRESEEKYRVVVDNANEAIVVIQDGLFRFVNARGLSGYTESELISKPITLLLHPEDRAMVMERHQRRVRGESFPNVYVFRIIDKEGNTRWLEINSVMISWNGRPAALSFLNDVSERIKADKEKKNLENQLRHVQKMEALGRFAGGIAHDLNNLLYPVILDIEMLLENIQPGDRSHEVLQQVLKAVYRQRDLVKQILSFSRRDTQKFSAVRLSPLVQETLGFMRASLPSTIEICRRINCPADSIMGDPVQIQQIIMNLCRNAADALESLKGRIEVSLENTYIATDAAHPEIKEGEYIRLAVRDKGRGMTKEVREMIFEPFFTTKEKGKGTGMGLSIVHGILKNHGGAITVESEPGKGSLFSVYLPLNSGKAPAEVPSPEIGPSARAGEKILLIDDEASILSSLERMFKISGYQVVAMQDSMDALSVFAQAPDDFDLIITDLSMPKMTGIELAGKVLAIRPDIPVILCTGFNDATTEQEARSLGIRELLLKPANSNELKKIVRSALEPRG